LAWLPRPPTRGRSYLACDGIPKIGSVSPVFRWSPSL